jgi:hypothetical protein
MYGGAVCAVETETKRTVSMTKTSQRSHFIKFSSVIELDYRNCSDPFINRCPMASL